MRTYTPEQQARRNLQARRQYLQKQLASQTEENPETLKEILRIMSDLNKHQLYQTMAAGYVAVAKASEKQAEANKSQAKANKSQANANKSQANAFDLQAKAFQDQAAAFDSQAKAFQDQAAASSIPYPMETFPRKLIVSE